MKLIFTTAIFILQIIFTYCQSAKSMGKLKLVHEFYRTGNRNPLYGKFQTTYNHDSGELTAVGQRQQYLLGNNIRNDYIISENFIPKQYDHQYFHNRGADYNRTLQSAQSHTQGMYPLETGPKAYTDQVEDQKIFNAALQPKQIEKYKEENDFCIENGYAPVTIHSAIPEKDQTLLGWDKGCFNIQKQIEENQESEEYSKQFEKYQDVVKILNNNLDISKIKTFQDLFEVIDDYLALKQIDQSFVSKEVQKIEDKIMQIQQEYINLVYFPTDSKLNLFAQPITGEILAHMKETNKQWYMYSTQGPQLLMLLRVLGLNNLECLEDTKKCQIYKYPEFASSLIIELRDNKKVKDEEIVMVRYNGEYLKGICQEDKNYCTKDEFLEILQKSNKSNGKKFDEFCETPDVVITEINETVPAYAWIIFGVLMGLIVLGGVVIHLMGRKIKNHNSHISEYGEQKPILQQELVA